MNDLQKIYSKNGEFVVKQVDEDYILVPLKSNVANMNVVYTLNDVGHFIWQQLDGKQDLSQIIDAVLNEFETDQLTAEKDTVEFVYMIQELLIAQN
jgi:methyltransferase-like protein